MKRSGFLAVVLAGALSACGSPSGPSSVFTPGIYSLIFKHGDTLTGTPPCSGLPSPASYLATIRFETDGAGFHGRGANFNANATIDVRIQLDGENVQGTITGSVRDESIPGLLPGPATLTFPAAGDGALARFVGRYVLSGFAGLGTVQGAATISIPSTPPLTGACTSGEVRWLLAPVG